MKRNIDVIMLLASITGVDIFALIFCKPVKFPSPSRDTVVAVEIIRMGAEKCDSFPLCLLSS